MVGIERLEVHSRSYIVRWVRADAGNTLSWSVQPHKKSIYFGIFKHPGSGATNLTSLSSDDVLHPPELDEGKANRSNKKDTACEILTSKGFIPVKWVGKCEADMVSIGTHDVLDGQGGMYGLVFDNTFSKQTSKTATFVVLTHPTGAPPQGASAIPNLQVPIDPDMQSSLARSNAFTDTEHGASTDSVHSPDASNRARSASNRTDFANAAPSHVGTLSKRRRKKGQGYARRFFSLDYSTYTLSYYYNRNSSALRGAIPLSLAAIAADERRREISIDSGAEVWHLRAPTIKEFQGWAHALEKASRAARNLEILQQASQPGLAGQRMAASRQKSSQQDEEEAEWRQVETLVSRVVGTRDALRRFAKDVATLPKTAASPGLLSPGSVNNGDDGESYFPVPERRPFWRRKSSAPGATPTSIQQALASTSGTSIDASGSKTAERKLKSPIQEENGLHAHCASLFADLDSVVGEFMSLISASKRRRLNQAVPDVATSRLSMESTASTVDEFFDAEDAKDVGSRVIKINESDGESSGESEEEEDDGASSSSINDESGATSGGAENANNLFPVKSKSLVPLPITSPIRRRGAIPPATVLPPSLIAFVRKNVGKDLSTISMPVSANEPLSLLQKLSEQLEYAELLDKAARNSSPTERLVHVTAFAVSQFSSGRARERAIRKPFNPLLGETFELVRGDADTPGGFRLLVEKVQHRPVKLAMHAESAGWLLSHSAAPGQKFWGKSAEITMDGRVRVVLHLADGSDERYSWNIANMFLRNVVMGEKYVEPVGTMTVANESTGHRASVEFRSRGMFGGRSEDVHVDTFHPDGSDTGTALVGTWTSELHVVVAAKGKRGGGGGAGAGAGDSTTIWRVGGLVENAPQTYGLTRFAATLNEVTEVEKGKVAPTDSRLRPDQRMAEEGRLDEAEEWKQKLEEAQRERRRRLEEDGGGGEAYKPRWFTAVRGSPDGEECWSLKTGKDGYWEERARGSWTGVTDIFKV